jgi:hypothetical protein
MRKRAKLIFDHLGRTGGTTLQWEVLFTIFPPEQIYGVDLPHPLIRHGTYEELANLPASVKNRLALVMGHMPFGAAEHLPRPESWDYITFLRDPVRRTVSEYYQIRDDTTSPAHPYAQRLDLCGFVLAGYGHTWNGMCYCLSNQAYGRTFASAHAMFGAAMLNAQQCAFVGITDRVDESLARLCRRFGWAVPAVGRRYSLTPTNRELTREERQVLREANEFDQLLYDHFEGRWAIDDSAERPMMTARLKNWLAGWKARPHSAARVPSSGAERDSSVGIS